VFELLIVYCFVEVMSELSICMKLSVLIFKALRLYSVCSSEWWNVFLT
jgi:hypothetical protein